MASPVATKAFESFEKALLGSEYGFTEEDVALIEEGESEHGLVQNWTRAAFDDVLGALRGRAAFEIVRTVKTGITDTGKVRESVIPTSAPYLSSQSEYDPHDPSQYYTDPETGELWRWDGKGVRQSVVLVEHRRFGDVLLPVEDAALAAIDESKQWFHHGFGVWVAGAKLLADPTLEQRDRVRVAMALRARQSDNMFSASRIPAMAG